jgi:rSAM/selenodomain-associated transferase 1
MTGNSTAAETLIVFTRYPEPGKVKTRLIPCLGPEGAADLQRRLTRHTLATARAARRPVVVRTSGGDSPAWDGLLGDLTRLDQGEGDLGERLARASRDAFDAGSRKVVVIGSDCPRLTPGRIDLAFRELDHVDLVFGPAEDGGYYLIGLTAPFPAVFEDIPWGGPAVMRTSLARAAGQKVALLASLPDVDRPGDLPDAEAAMSAAPADIPCLHCPPIPLSSAVPNKG